MPPLNLLKRASQACASAVKVKGQNRTIDRKYSHTSLSPEFADPSAKVLEGRFGRDLIPEKPEPVGPVQLAVEDGLGGGDGGVAGLGEVDLGVDDGDTAGRSGAIKSCQSLRRGGMKRTG